jgi:hypothetical protein
LQSLHPASSKDQVEESGGKVVSRRKKMTDRTTRLLIVILILFLITEFPQVTRKRRRGLLSEAATGHA